MKDELLNLGKVKPQDSRNRSSGGKFVFFSTSARKLAKKFFSGAAVFTGIVYLVDYGFRYISSNDDNNYSDNNYNSKRNGK